MSRNNALEFLQETFDECYDKQDTIKRVAGVINYVVADSHDKLADVQIGTKHLVMLNKSGELLEEGDHVWVYYWNTLADGYIALRCGEARNIGGGIKNAGVLTEQQDTVYNIAKDIAIVDTENKAKAYYTNANNIILINKYTAVAMSIDTYPENESTISWATDTDGANDLKARIAAMNSRLWSNKIKSYWIPASSSAFTLGNEYTYYLQLRSMELMYNAPVSHQFAWIYRLGIYCEENGWGATIPTIMSETPNGLEDCGLITIYDSLNAPTSGVFNNKPTANAALAVCVGSNSNMYGAYLPAGATEPSYKRVTGLAYGFPLTSVAFYDIDEYNYAIALTTERDIISSNV